MFIHSVILHFRKCFEIFQCIHVTQLSECFIFVDKIKYQNDELDTINGPDHEHGEIEPFDDLEL